MSNKSQKRRRSNIYLFRLFEEPLSNKEGRYLLTTNLNDITTKDEVLYRHEYEIYDPEELKHIEVLKLERQGIEYEQVSYYGGCLQEFKEYGYKVEYNSPTSSFIKYKNPKVFSSIDHEIDCMIEVITGEALDDMREAEEYLRQRELSRSDLT